MPIKPTDFTYFGCLESGRVPSNVFLNCQFEAMMAIIGMFFQACRFSWFSRGCKRRGSNHPTTIFQDFLLFLSGNLHVYYLHPNFFKVRNLFHRNINFGSGHQCFKILFLRWMDGWMRLPSKRSMIRVSKSALLEGVWVFAGFSVPCLSL